MQDQFPYGENDEEMEMVQGTLVRALSHHVRCLCAALDSFSPEYMIRDWLPLGQLFGTIDNLVGFIFLIDFGHAYYERIVCTLEPEKKSCFQKDSSGKEKIYIRNEEC